MLKVRVPGDMIAHVGTVLGETAWREITQHEITAFAGLTGDDHWIHVDEARAATEMPDGRTIAHGLYLLALIPRLQRELFLIERRGAGLNYGYDRVRFTAPVQVGANVRLRQRLTSAAPHPAGTRLGIESVIEVQGQTKPAIVADGVLLIADAR